MTIPKTVRDALAHPGWRQAMTDELSVLHNSGTWELVPLPIGKSVVGCKWVFAIKVDLMVLLIASKLVLWPKVILKFLG